MILISARQFLSPDPGVWLSLFLTLAMLSMPLLAAQTDAFYELEIRPSICVSFDRDEACTMMLQINWQGDSRQEVCLRTDDNDVFITCWNGELAGSAEIPYANTDNVVYQLVSMQNGQVLAEAQVQVISRDLRDSRRRRRHVWSIL